MFNTEYFKCYKHRSIKLHYRIQRKPISTGDGWVMHQILRYVYRYVCNQCLQQLAKVLRLINQVAHIAAGWWILLRRLKEKNWAGLVIC